MTGRLYFGVPLHVGSGARLTDAGGDAGAVGVSHMFVGLSMPYNGREPRMENPPGESEAPKWVPKGGVVFEGGENLLQGKTSVIQN